jgi:4-hydroxy-3-methylbut-2-enyl diphosphate reductase
VLLVLLALVAGGAGLLTAYTMGISSFLILFAMSAMGLSYNLKLVPEHFAKSNYRRIRDIPGSKTVLIAVAWGIVTSVLPSFSESGWMNLATTSVFLTTTCLVFARTAFFDILDMQGDRIVGKETIPILIGEKATMRLLKAMLITVMVILFLSSAFHTISSLGFALILCPVFMLSVILTYERGYIPPGIRLEFLVETDFVLAGILTVIWSVF